MSGSPETAAILEALNSQRADARERQAAMERQIREEARRLRGGITGTKGALSALHLRHSSDCSCKCISRWHTDIPAVVQSLVSCNGYA